jgi:uncharacterized membrane protein YjjP (DUF1212 family)
MSAERPVCDNCPMNLDREVDRLAIRVERFGDDIKQINEKLDKILDDRSTLLGIVWAVRILFGALGAAVFYFISHDLPESVKRFFN